MTDDDLPRSLDALRADITRCDAALLERLAERRGLVLEVARAKLDRPRPVRDRAREEALLARLVRVGREAHGLDASLVTAVFHAIIEDSVLTQQAWFEARANPDEGAGQPRVAFLGERGSYSQLAARRFFARRRERIQELGLARFVDVVNAVLDGVAEFGVLPVENSTTGSITEVFDLLQRSTVHIVGEVTHDVVHALLVRGDARDAVERAASLDAIAEVHGHPQALQQCREWLDRNLPQAERRLAASTSEAMARAAQAASDEAGPSRAAIGSVSGGALYGLVPQVEGIADIRGNQTRFLVVARQPRAVPAQVPARTTLMISTGQAPGALVEALVVLRDRGLSMTRLESRPIRGNPWEEMFHVDVDGNVDSPEMQAALEALRATTRTLKVLGCYPVESVTPTPVPREARIASSASGSPVIGEARSGGGEGTASGVRPVPGPAATDGSVGGASVTPQGGSAHPSRADAGRHESGARSNTPAATRSAGATVEPPPSDASSSSLPSGDAQGAGAGSPGASVDRVVRLGHGSAAVAVRSGAGLGLAMVAVPLGADAAHAQQVARLAVDAGVDALVVVLPPGWSVRDPVRAAGLAWLDHARASGLPLVVAVRSAEEVAATETCADAVWCGDDTGDDALLAAARRPRPVCVASADAARLRTRIERVRAAGNQQAVAVLRGALDLAQLPALTDIAPLLCALPASAEPSVLQRTAAALRAAGAAGVVGAWPLPALGEAMRALAGAGG